MLDLSLPPQDSPSQPSNALLKKKYSKVNEALRSRFLQLIVEENMSIKEASIALNINYSSAKAILSNHRKTVINAHRKAPRNCPRASFRPLSAFQSFLNPIGHFVCTTGGKEVSCMQTQLPQRHTLKAPIILLAASKEHDSQENTSQSH